MRYFINFAAVLVVCLSMSLAKAQNKVVVVPLGGGKGSSAPVAKTGQALCYNQAGSSIPCDDTGQDGELQKGATVTPRFVDNGDGTVTDKLTGLIWLREGNCTAFFSGDLTGVNARAWQQALDAANQLSSSYCGLTDGSLAGDWRLPNLRELQSLVDYSQIGPSLSPGHPFVGLTMSSYYWSSTTHAFDPYFAWCVYFYSGELTSGYKSGNYSVRTVRGGQ